MDTEHATERATALGGIETRLLNAQNAAKMVDAATETYRSARTVLHTARGVYDRALYSWALAYDTHRALLTDEDRDIAVRCIPFDAFFGYDSSDPPTAAEHGITLVAQAGANVFAVGHEASMLALVSGKSVEYRWNGHLICVTLESARDRIRRLLDVP